jgi:hypothetical protein
MLKTVKRCSRHQAGGAAEALDDPLPHRLVPRDDLGRLGDDGHLAHEKLVEDGLHPVELPERDDEKVLVAVPAPALLDLVAADCVDQVPVLGMILFRSESHRTVVLLTVVLDQPESADPVHGEVESVLSWKVSLSLAPLGLVRDMVTDEIVVDYLFTFGMFTARTTARLIETICWFGPPFMVSGHRTLPPDHLRAASHEVIRGQGAVLGRMPLSRYRGMYSCEAI